MTQHGPNNDFLVQNCPDDSISSLSWSPTASYLVGTCWNNEVLMWEVQNSAQTVAKAKHKHDAPVLCSAFSGDGQRVYTAGCDNLAKAWDLGSNKQMVVAKHDQPIRALSYINEMNSLVTGSWDRTLKYWDTRTPNPQANVSLPQRVYCMDVKYPVCVVGTADRHVMIYDLRNPTSPFRQIVSSLKHQTRCVSVFPDKQGFAYASIEGRCAISHLLEKDQSRNFAFKCHRQSQGNDVYAVNCISFHPSFGTFATGGADGRFTFWDKDSKQRLKQFQRNGNPITDCKFNRDGSIFAYSVSYDWSKGMEFAQTQKQPNCIYLHAVKDECKPRPKKS